MPIDREVFESFCSSVQESQAVRFTGRERELCVGDRGTWGSIGYKGAIIRPMSIDQVPL